MLGGFGAGAAVASKAGSGSAGTKVAKLMQLAVDAQLAGKLDESRDLYLQVLQYDPHRAHALHNLGVMLYRSEDYSASISYVFRAIQSLDLPAPHNAPIQPHRPSSLDSNACSTVISTPIARTAATGVGQTAAGFFNTLGVVYRAAGLRRSIFFTRQQSNIEPLAGQPDLAAGSFERALSATGLAAATPSTCINYAELLHHSYAYPVRASALHRAACLVCLLHA